VLFGFPNQNSLQGFVNKLDWQIGGNMECFIIPVKALPLERLANKLPFLKSLYNSFVKHQLKPCLSTRNGIRNSVIDEGYCGVQRDNDYLNYKINYTSSFTIKVDTTQIWFKINDGMFIGDINLSLNDLDNIIPHLQKITRRLGLKKIIFQADKRTVLHMLLKNHAQSIPSFPVIIKNLREDLPLHKMAFTFADIDIF
jgi:hypothetical protein